MSYRVLCPVLVSFLLVSGASWADEKGGHHHHSPHGGQVRDAGSIHLEALVKEGKFLVYALDAKEKTLPAPAEGSVKLVVGKDVYDLVLKPEGEALAAALPAGVEGKALVAVVVVKMDSGPKTARFKLGQARPHHPPHEEKARPDAPAK